MVGPSTQRKEVLFCFISRLHESVRDEFQKISRHEAVRPVVNPTYWGVISHVGAVLKASDVVWARMLVVVQIVN